MSQFRYILESYKGTKARYSCPKCKKGGEFSRYVDTMTGEQVAPNVGMCNRMNKCGYHYPPSKYFEEKGILPDSKSRYTSPESVITSQPKPVSFIPIDIFKQSLLMGKNIWQVAEQNNFVKFLINTFRANITSQLISRYFIGTSEQWNGSTVFWQIDITGKIRTGKIMLYNSSGKRVKEPFDHINFMHKSIKQPDFELRQCFFGEHLLLENKTKTVAIAESEKTAIIASMYFPQFIWLGSGGIGGLNAEKCKVLRGRKVILFPDLKRGYEDWKRKADELKYITGFIVSDLLERNALDGECKQGLDLADYLINQDYLEFVLSAPQSTEQSTGYQPLVEVKQSESLDTADYDAELRQHQISTGMIDGGNDE